MSSHSNPGTLSTKQRRRLFRLFRDDVLAWLCCLRTAGSAELEGLPQRFPFAPEPLHWRFPIRDTTTRPGKPERRVDFGLEIAFKERKEVTEAMVWVARMSE